MSNPVALIPSHLFDATIEHIKTNLIERLRFSGIIDPEPLVLLTRSPNMPIRYEARLYSMAPQQRVHLCGRADNMEGAMSELLRKSQEFAWDVGR